MTRFETTDGIQLGARMATKEGARFWLTEEEWSNLEQLDDNAHIISDNAWCGSKQELLDEILDCGLATKEHMLKCWGSTGSLHIKETLFIDKDGTIKTKFSR